MRSRIKAQSAMEYLMTYGWAILIIAVVLGALYQLGIFSTLTQGPKASAGSCLVYRPNGPGTSFDISLEGQCSGELPQYTTQINGGGNVTIPNEPALQLNAMTIAVWVKPTAYPGVSGDIVDKRSFCALSINDFPYEVDMGSNGHVSYTLSSGAGFFDTKAITTNTGLSLNTWYLLVATYDGTTENIYINGVQAATPVVYGNTLAINSEPVKFGSVSTAQLPCGSQEFFTGGIANVQIYNASLSASEIQALYLEGIGGAPVKPQTLVGWWPLNGNANDYSGNNDAGSTNAVSFTGSWTSGYTVP